MLIWATHGTWAFWSRIARSSDLVRFTLIAKLSSMKKTPTLPPSAAARAFSRRISSTTLWSVRKRIESPKKPVTVQKSQP